MIVRRRFLGPERGWRSPFEELEEMRNRVERLSHAMGGQAGTRRNAGVYPLINVSEDADNYYVRAELPGVESDQLNLSITGNSLAISGERKIGAEDESAKYHRREREAGKFSRMVELPDHVEGDKVEASIKEGILCVKLPKSPAAKPRQISVK